MRYTYIVKVTFTHAASHVAQANWRPADDVDNRDQVRPGTPLRFASLRLHTMEKSLMSLRRTVEPGVHLSEKWSAQLVNVATSTSKRKLRMDALRLSTF